MKRIDTKTQKTNPFQLIKFCFFLLFTVHSSYAITYYARASGEWNTTTTWSTTSRTGATAGTIPGVSDDVIIDAYDVTLSVANQSCNSLTISTSFYAVSSLLISNGKTFTVVANVNLLQNTANMYVTQTFRAFGNGTIVNVGGNFIVNITTEECIAPTVELRDNAVLTVTGNYSHTDIAPEYNLTNEVDLDNTSTLNCTNFTVNRTGTNEDPEDFNIDLSTGSTLNISGAFSYTGLNTGSFPYGSLVVNVAGTSHLNISGSTTITLDNCENTNEKSPQINLSGSAQFNTTGNFSCTKTNIMGVGQINVGNISTDACQFNVSGAFTWSNTAEQNGPYTIREQFYTQGTGLFDVNGNFSYTNSDASNSLHGVILLANTATFNIGTTTANSHVFEVDISDDDALHGAHINVPVGCTMNVGGNLRFKISDNPPYVPTYNQISILGTVNITGNLVLQNATTTCNLRTGISPTASSGLLNVDGNIDMTNATAANKILMTVANTGKLEIGGSFLRGVSPNNYGKLTCSGTSSVEYNGATNTQFFSQSGAETWAYQNLTINNTFGTSPQLTTDAPITIPAGRNLVFTNGIIATTSTNLIIISNTATVSGASNNSYVDGYIRKVGSQAFTFPVGDAGFYAPIEISAPTTTTHAFTARYQRINPGSVGYNPASILAPVANVSSVEYWDLDRTTGTSDVTVKLSWDAARSGGVSVLADMLVGHWTGSQWDSKGNGGTTGSASSGTVISSGAVSTFSPFTLASSSQLNALPIELIDFTAEWENNENTKSKLSWTTESEVNNHFFTVEKSIDAINFEKVIDIDGAGNSNTVLHYNTLDILSDFYPEIYYRLKQTDFNGNYTYSNTVALTSKLLPIICTNIYPNPVSNNLNIAVNANEEELNIEFYNIKGQLIKSFNIKTNLNGNVNIDVSEFAEGIYNMLIKKDNQLIKQERLVVLHEGN